MRSLPFDDPTAAALVAAIHDGDVASLELQLHDHPSLAAVRIVDEHGTSRTLLHVVADWPGHFPNAARTVAALAAAGADVDAHVVHGSASRPAATPLHWAASSDDVVVIDALLDAGANIEEPGASFTGGTPMSDAVVFAQWKAARRLFERGAATTIWQAAALGLLDRVQALDAGAAIPAEQITNAFWHACRGGQRATAEYLLGRGADMNWVGHDRKTPYDAARASGNEDLIAWLRTRGATSAGRV